MAQKILGTDLGTNSIGLSLRNPELGENLIDQLEYYSSIIFKSGVGYAKSGEYSYAAERTSHRSTRRLYQSRKYRIWATLKLLIEQGYCPLSMEDLERWSRYDKARGLKRQYPVDAEKFEQWVRLDFDGDGVADYSSPYQLRAELMTRQFDFSQEIERYRLGRALYHIAQRRGFKSSKGETAAEQEAAQKDIAVENVEVEAAAELQKSEEKKSKSIVDYMHKHNLPTVGCALAHLENKGIRVRNSEYQPVRSQYKEEVIAIFNYQKGLSTDSDLFRGLVSEKKGEGTIFYKRSLRSQKGLVGNCTLEPSKPRCPISHPDFEFFRAYSFINNIKYRTAPDADWQTLSPELKRQLFNDRFLLARNYFKFDDIRGWLEKQLGLKLSITKEAKTINYKDNVSVSGCPVTYRLRKILGDDWRNATLQGTSDHTDRKTGETHPATYSYEDLWHIAFTYDEAEAVRQFAIDKLGFDEPQAKEMIALWSAVSQGYSTLSLKAIRNINRFLAKGLIYTDAVLLAKLPDIVGEDFWQQNEALLLAELSTLTSHNREQRQTFNIVNNLISQYKAQNIEDRQAEHNTDYKLQPSDYADIEQCIEEALGSRWNNMGDEAKEALRAQVADLYQQFFASSKRDYLKLPKLGDSIKSFLSDNLADVDALHWERLYHPSQIETYAPAREQIVEIDGKMMGIRPLPKPTLGAIRNPVAMRTLYNLYHSINALLHKGLIDEDTKIIVETARELNDANMRWAIEEYQRQREKENKEYEKLIAELDSTRTISKDDKDKVRLLFDQHDIPEQGTPSAPKKETKKKKDTKGESYGAVKSADIKKYRLWLEQGCRCVYTGKVISLSDLFGDNKFDFEHTIPRSLSFDDSLQNLTVCDADFNRKVKQNQIPSQLNNHAEILLRIQPWIDKVEHLKDQVEFWRGQAKRAATKDRKDQCIRQRHLWQMELDYWKAKVERFTIKKEDLTFGFKNSQLVDTRIITKYAYHYLKSAFNNVEVQKGEVTDAFRKILGIQSADEKKSRDLHSHHAIDATMLTVMPAAAKRDKMLKLFYEIQEGKNRGANTATLELALRREIQGCFIGHIDGLVETIEGNILVNHIAKDQTLTPARRRKRIRGKVVPDQWVTGDCVRARLHQDSFYGAITRGKKDTNGKLMRNEDGSIVKDSEILYVKRVDLKAKSNSQDSGFGDWADLEKVIVDKDLFKMMKSQFGENVSFKEACAQGIYMLDKHGNRVNQIRHIRCYANVKNPLAIKKQTYLSKTDYKQHYYASVGDLYAMCEYCNNTERSFVIYSAFDISQNRLAGLEDIPSTIDGKHKSTLNLSRKIIRGKMLLIYDKLKEEIYDMDKNNLSKRLYVVDGFESDGRIKLKRHLTAVKDKDLGNGESINDFANLPLKIRCGVRSLNFLVENEDFSLTPIGIQFK